MSTLEQRSNVPRLALRVAEAAEALGVSVDFFAESVADELRCVRRGRVKLYAVAELERWLERNAARGSKGRLGAALSVVRAS